MLGLKEVTARYDDAGLVKIMVRDQNDLSKVGYSGEILFIPDSFEVSANPVQIVGRNFPVNVKALDKDKNVTRNYRGPAKIEAVPMIPSSNSGG